MDALAETLSGKLEGWSTDTATEVRTLVAEIIAHADNDTLDLARSRQAEQEVLDLLDDAPATR